MEGRSDQMPTETSTTVQRWRCTVSPRCVPLRAANGKGEEFDVTEDNLDDRAVELAYKLYEK